MKFWRVPPAPDVEARGLLLALVAALFALSVASLAIGRYPLSLGAIVDILLGRDSDAPGRATAETILLLVRLPRIATAVMIGAGLSLAGAAYQTVFRNPMASPALLGVSAGAGFGASLALLFQLRRSPWRRPPFAADSPPSPPPISRRAAFAAIRC
jgi:iron complex transport system permease protein